MFVWYMTYTNGVLDTVSTNGTPIVNTLGELYTQLDNDWKPTTFADYAGATNVDMLQRHVTLGMQVINVLEDNVMQANFYTEPVFDVDWRAGTQSMTNSTWRLQKNDYKWARATVATSPPSVDLHFNIDTTPSWLRVDRKLASSTVWDINISGNLSVNATNYTDNSASLVAGEVYDYRIYTINTFGQGGPKTYLRVGLNAAPVENRGHLVLLVDKTLTNGLATSLVDFQTDLVGDGWAISRYDVPRHEDSTVGTNYFLTNYSNILANRQIVQYEATNNGAKGVVIVGHVTIPYSGNHAIDGHDSTPLKRPDHQGAWPSDGYYGDIDSTWTDSSINYTNVDFEANSNYPADGKFDQDYLPKLELFVGRIDFARMPAFTSDSPAVSETDLIKRYIYKSRAYRRGEASVSFDANAFLGTSLGLGYQADDSQTTSRAFRNMMALSVAGAADFRLSEPFRQTSLNSALIAIANGKGQSDGMFMDFPLAFTSSQLKLLPFEPQVAFYSLYGSYFIDWNMTNSLLRAVIATETNGFGAVIAKGWAKCDYSWAVGEPVGTSLVISSDSVEVGEAMTRAVGWMGDPTLRPHALPAPTGVTAQKSGNDVVLTWNAGPQGALYGVYRSTNAFGPFSSVTTNGYISESSFTNFNAPSGILKYMVRRLELQTTGAGAYTNISQGTFAEVN